MSISVGVRKGAEKAKRKAPRGIHVSLPNSSQQRTDVAVIKGNVAVSLRNWVVKSDTGEASCGAYVSPSPRAGAPLGQYGRELEIRESTLRGGTIEEIIQSVVVAVALGAYDV